jgi:hypothetical protein
VARTGLKTAKKFARGIRSIERRQILGVDALPPPHPAALVDSMNYKRVLS